MLKVWLSNVFSLDERFIMHRYQSTRWAVIVGSTLMAGWVLYEYYVKHTLRSDLLLILLAMALTKVLVMLYLRLTH